MGWHPAQKPPRGTILNPAHPLARGLFAAYIFNEHSSQIIKDVAGGIYHGTLTAGTIVPGGVSFNGSSSYLSISNVLPAEYVSPYNQQSIFTIATNSNTTKDSCGLICFGNSASNNDVYAIAQNAVDNSITIFLRNNAGQYLTDWNTTHQTNAYVQNIPFSVGWTNNGGDAKLFLNGIQSAVDFSFSPSGTFTLNRFTIGAFGRVGVGFYWPGTVYLSYFYNRVLTPSEVSLLHREPYAMFEQPSRAKYFFYEAAGGDTITHLFLRQYKARRQ
jgi:hypothetical protein